MCSTSIALQETKKNLREVCQYLKKNRIDRTRFWRKVGNVLVCNEEALEHVMERSAGQRPQMGIVVRCCSCGTVHLSRDKCGGDRNARQKRQRANRERSRDDRTLSCALTQALSPLQGGSASRTTERPGKLQFLQQLSVTRFEKGKKIRSEQDQAIYVGISNPINRLAGMNENGGGKNMEKDKKGTNGC